MSACPAGPTTLRIRFVMVMRIALWVNARRAGGAVEELPA
jgi:hypothetical protein